MAEISNLRSVTYATLSDQAYEILRDSILRQEFPSGRRLDLDELQEQLSISRTPLKEALKRLAAEGLVTIIPWRGTYVVDLEPEDIAERFDIRQILELGIVDVVIDNLTEEKLNELRRLYAATAAFLTPDGSASDYFAYLESDIEFHREIMRMAGNKQLVEIYDGLNLKLQMARVFYLESDKRIREVDLEHQVILQALEARDKKALRSAIRTHIQNAKHAVACRLKKS